MRILTCFKIVSETESLLPSELQAICNQEYDWAYAKKVIGGYDEAALETAIRLWDDICGAGGIDDAGGAGLYALTVGECADRFAENLYALGFREVAKITPRADVDYAPFHVASLIYSYVKQHRGFDIVLTGRQSSPGENALTGHILASLMGVPCIPNVTALSFVGGKAAITAKTAANSYCSMEVNGRLVCTVGEVQHPYLRIPTLREKMRASKKKAIAFEPPDDEALIFQENSANMELIGYSFDLPDKNCVYIGGGMADKAAEMLRLIEAGGTRAASYSSPEPGASSDGNAQGDVI